MTRTTLERAIQIGLRRGAGRDPQIQVGLIADAIETAIEIGEDAPAQKVAPVIDWPIKTGEPAPKVAPLPPPPQAVVDPSAGRTPVSEPVQIRHLDTSNTTTPIALDKLVQILNENTPPVISVSFPGKAPYELERNVIADTMAKSARLIYKHPPAPEGIEASVVFLADNGIPDLTSAMNAVESVALKVYAPKTVSAPAPIAEVSGPVVESVRTSRMDPSSIPDMREIDGLSFPGGFSFK
jgi:hypothetical protein